jgi:uncharacterized protein YjbI with pentapeptide repeats
MASKEHLNIIEKGLDFWNRWRIKKPYIVPDLTCADLSGRDFSKFTIKRFGSLYGKLPHFDGWEYSHSTIFRRTNFSGANLSRANLSGADLSEAIFAPIGIDKVYEEYYNAKEAYEVASADLNDHDSMYGSVYLNVMNPVDSRIQAATRALQTREDAYIINSSTRTSLKEAILKDADLRGADLSGALLNRTDLRGANLCEVRAIGTNFEGANITGACISNWVVSKDTNFTGVTCDYLFLKEGYQDRRPFDTEKTYAPGEIEILLREVTDTIDLIFTDGIDWKAFFASFQALRKEYQKDDIAIQAIERKNKDFVVRLEVKSSVKEKVAVDKFFWAQYEQRLKRLESEVSGYRQLIASERKERSTLLGIVETLSKNQSERISIVQSNINAMSVDGGEAKATEFHNVYANNLIEEKMGDTYKINARGDIAFAKDQAIVTLNKSIRNADISEYLERSLEHLTTIVDELVSVHLTPSSQARPGMAYTPSTMRRTYA